MITHLLQLQEKATPLIQKTYFLSAISELGKNKEFIIDHNNIFSKSVTLQKTQTQPIPQKKVAAIQGIANTPIVTDVALGQQKRISVNYNTNPAPNSKPVDNHEFLETNQFLFLLMIILPPTNQKTINRDHQ